MTIIFDEQKQALKLLEHGFDRFMSTRDLIIIAKYLKYVGKNTDQIRHDLEEYCLKFNPAFNSIISSNKIDFVIKSAKKNKLRLHVDVPITQKELDIIKAIKNYNLEKILFVMLVSAKALTVSKDIKDTCFVRGRFAEFLGLAKVHVNKKERYKLLYNLNQSNLINATSYADIFKINFIDFDGETILIVTDASNSINFYPVYCEECGKTIVKKGKNHRMCSECWKEKNKIQIRERVRKHRIVL